MKTVSDIGEHALIERIANRLHQDAAPGGPGDDAAVLPPTEGPLVFTTDVLVENVDFDFAYCSGADVGWKAIAANASDVAAMGGAPRWAVAAVCMRHDTAVALIDDLLDGMVAASGRWGIGLVGGDVSSAPALSVAVSMIGVSGGRGPVLRSGATPGDRICVTGSLGGAAAGLAVLRGGLERDGVVGRLAARHLRPVARVEEGHAVGEIGPTAMIDISDGLAVDLGHIVDSSGVGCAVELDRIPVDPDLHELKSKLGADAPDPIETAVLGGEDFELLFTIAEERTGQARDALERAGSEMTDIGAIIEGERTIGERSLEEWRKLGWEHLRAR
jgi:thiamine-monophosphate kinase